MSKAYLNLAFTPAVKAQQERLGSRRSYARLDEMGEGETDRFSRSEAEFISARDGFYLSTVNEDGWPYVQFRGGERGFLKVLDDQTLAFLDLRGNRQYVSVGNLSTNDKVALFLMDYPNQRRLKVWGHARVEEDAAAIFPDADLKGAERAIVITLIAYDWNCPQHIPRRFTVEELQELGVL